MSVLHLACQHRQTIDNQLNRDLIARARLQGFVFSKPFEDAETWLELETVKPEDPTA